MNEFARFSKRAVEYLFDRPARNEDMSPIWCLGRSYESDYQPDRPASSGGALPGTSPSAQSDASHADSAVVTKAGNTHDEHKVENDDELVKSFDQVQLSKSMDEEDLGWPSDFIDDFESRIWITYRDGFPPIAKSSDPAAGSKMSFTTKLRSLTNQQGFTSDTGWGCMIRSGQSLLANTLVLQRLGREWRKGQRAEEHKSILSLFADTPEAPFSIHKFVEHGAQACGTYPGEWFGPSATARCLRALTDKYHEAGLRVYARPNDSDVYADAVIETASQKDADDKFQPTLIVLGIRLGIEKVTLAYHAALKAVLELPQSVGIAGGRPSSSHYFLGHQGDAFFYLDPHTTRPMLSPQPSAEDVDTCHTRRIRKLPLSEMDPSMLLGFLVHSRDEFEQWRKAVSDLPGKAIIHIHETEPKYATGSERPEAIDEVETMDETLDDEDDDEGEKI
ncbi:Putative peptidase C54, papain-like cysteine peptidase superfamily [Septoria linicola]|uniref:Cysteine protease n=1 Tax=Septoria linicola TaxID=215465 RepID=A0A9Q9B5U2_9PEZI|nr:Putative peptidase C54, papain-like cysteine peptidase superfamily [Septoria linicola]